MAPPPVCQALFLSFQVSLPGSPGAGMTYFFQATLPVAASSAAMKSRTPWSPPAAPTMMLSLTGSAAAGQRQLLLARTHARDDAAGVAGAAVDLVDDAPLVDDVEEAVLGQRCRLQVLVRRRAADRHRIGELEALDVVLVDARQRRITMRIIGAVVHQPVLRLLVGV